MEPLVDVDAVASRASRYWMEDGLVEIMLGLMMSVQSGLYLAAGALSRGPSTDLVSTFGVQALSLGVTLSIFRGFKKLKARITFPRSGYVALPKPTRMGRIAMFATFAVFGITFTLALSARVVVVPTFAAVFSACMLGGGLQYKQPSMVWEAFLTLLFAASLSWFTNLNGAKGVMTLMVMVGTSMAIIGAFRLRSFLKANPRCQETEA